MEKDEFFGSYFSLNRFCSSSRVHWIFFHLSRKESEPRHSAFRDRSGNFLSLSHETTSCPRGQRTKPEHDSRNVKGLSAVSASYRGISRFLPIRQRDRRSMNESRYFVTAAGFQNVMTPLPMLVKRYNSEFFTFLRWISPPDDYVFFLSLEDDKLSEKENLIKFRRNDSWS